MREIKFRAWCPQIRRMLDVWEIWHITDGEPKYASCKLPREDSCGGFDLYKCKVTDGDCYLMQYTGLKDKNGREIYEGDIVEVTDEEGSVDAMNCGSGPVEYLDNHLMWYVSGSVNNAFVDLVHDYYFEVIGNIYENPELVK